MASRYSVIQYVPDPVTDERINIGVLVLGVDYVRAKFLKKWGRVSRFSPSSDISFLEEFADRFQYQVNEGQLELYAENTDPSEFISEVAGKCMNSIQFTELRGSLIPADRLLEDVTARFLFEPKARERARGKRSATSLLRKGIHKVLKSEIGSKVDEALAVNVTLQGEHDHHKADIGVRNGHWIAAGYGLSFEVKTDLQKDIDATAWAIDDLRKQSPELQVGIMTIPPRREQEDTFRRAKRIFESLSATVLSEKTVTDWAKKLSRDLSSS